MMEVVNLRYILSTFGNVTMYPQFNNNMLIKIEIKKKNKVSSGTYPHDARFC
jgi:hypothetical protein